MNNRIFVDFIYIILFYSAELTDIKVTQSRPCAGLLQARIPGSWGSLRWYGCQPSSPHEIFLVFVSVRGWVDPTLRIMPMKNKNWYNWESNQRPFNFITQCLNQLCHRLLQVLAICTQLSAGLSHPYQKDLTPCCWPYDNKFMIVSGSETQKCVSPILSYLKQ